MQPCNGYLGRSQTHLRQEHFSGAEELPDGGHSRHEGTLDDVQRPRVTLAVRPRNLGVLHDVGVDPLDQGVPEERISTLCRVTLVVAHLG